MARTTSRPAIDLSVDGSSELMSDKLYPRIDVTPLSRRTSRRPITWMIGLTLVVLVLLAGAAYGLVSLVAKLLGSSA